MTSDDAHGPEDEGSLARRIADGPAPDAERELAVRFGGRIRVDGIRHLRSEERARDLVQEVLAIVLDALRRLGLSAGNVRVIRHRALRAIRTCLGVGVEA